MTPPLYVSRAGTTCRRLAPAAAHKVRHGMMNARKRPWERRDRRVPIYGKRDQGSARFGEGAIGGGNRVNRGPSGHERPRSRGMLEAPRSAEHVVGAALKRTDRAEARSDRAQRDSDHEPKGSGYGLVGDIAVGIIGNAAGSSGRPSSP